MCARGRSPCWQGRGRHACNGLLHASMLLATLATSIAPVRGGRSWGRRTSVDSSSLAPGGSILHAPVQHAPVVSASTQPDAPFEECCFATGVPVASRTMPKDMAFLIGAQKSGTTFLFHELVQRHPDIHGPQVYSHNVSTNTSRGTLIKEPHFFDAVPLGSFDAYLDQWQQAGTWLDGTPDYLLVPAAACRIAAAFPGAKLIAVLKDPVQRALSAWNMARHKRASTRSFKEEIEAELSRLRRLGCTFEGAVGDPGAPQEGTSGTAQWRRPDGLPSWNECFRCMFSYCNKYNGPTSGDVCKDPQGEGFGTSFVRRGLYVYQLEWWLRHFPARQMMVINAEQLQSDYEATLDKILVFLGRDPEMKLPAELVKRHAYSLPHDDEQDNSATLHKLYDFYRHANSELYKLMGVLGPESGWMGAFPTELAPKHATA